MSSILSRLYPELRSELLQWLDESDMMTLITVDKSWEPLVEAHIRNTMRPWYDIHMLRILGENNALLTIRNLPPLNISSITTIIEGACSRGHRSLFHHMVNKYLSFGVIAEIWTNAFAAACARDDREFPQEIIQHPHSRFTLYLRQKACYTAARYNRTELLQWLINTPFITSDKVHGAKKGTISRKDYDQGVITNPHGLARVNDVDNEVTVCLYQYVVDDNKILEGICYGNSNMDSEQQIKLASTMIDKLGPMPNINSAYQAAAKGGNLPLLQWLEPLKSFDHERVFMDACRETHPGSEAVRQYLLQKLPPINTWSFTTIASALLTASCDGNLSLVQQLVPYLSTSVPNTSIPDTLIPDTPIPDTLIPDTQIPDTLIPSDLCQAMLERATRGNFRPLMEWCSSHI